MVGREEGIICELFVLNWMFFSVMVWLVVIFECLILVMVVLVGCGGVGVGVWVIGGVLGCEGECGVVFVSGLFVGLGFCGLLGIEVL